MESASGYSITMPKISTRENAAAFMDYFKELVNESGILELKTFCKTLDHWRENILNYNKTNFLLRLKLECA